MHTAPGLEATIGISRTKILWIAVTIVNQNRPLRLPGTWTMRCFVFLSERWRCKVEGWMEAGDWLKLPLKGTAGRKAVLVELCPINGFHWVELFPSVMVLWISKYRKNLDYQWMGEPWVNSPIQLWQWLLSPQYGINESQSWILSSLPCSKKMQHKCGETVTSLLIRYNSSLLLESKVLHEMFPKLCRKPNLLGCLASFLPLHGATTKCSLTAHINISYAFTASACVCDLNSASVKCKCKLSCCGWILVDSRQWD